MASIKVLDDESLCNFFTNEDGEFIVVASGSDSHSRNLVKQFEQNNDNIGLYRLIEPHSVGVNIIQTQLEIATVPAIIYAKNCKIDILKDVIKYEEITEWMKQRQ